LLAIACAHAGPALAPSVPEAPPAQAQPAAPDRQAEGAPAIPAPLPELPQELTLAAVGDVMLGSTFPDSDKGEPPQLPPDDGAQLLSEVSPILAAADLALGNLEGPMLEGGSSTKCRTRSTCYAFRVPIRYGHHLAKAGFKAMTLANNHSGDFGVAGRESTRKVLDALGIAHTGEVGDVARLVVKGRRVAVIGFAPNDGCYDLNDLEAARKEVSALAASADLVVVFFHGGAEGAAYQHVAPEEEDFLGENRGDLRAFAHAVIDAGAAVVIGSGPHVVRGMELYRGRLVAYSLGNFATYGRFNLAGPNGLSLILEARLGPDGSFLSGRIHPVKQAKPGGPRLDPAGEVIAKVRELSLQDFGSAAVQVGADGSLRPAQAPQTPAAEHASPSVPPGA
jgi:hypothetical protein